MAIEDALSGEPAGYNGAARHLQPHAHRVRRHDAVVPQGQADWCVCCADMMSDAQRHTGSELWTVVTSLI